MRSSFPIYTAGAFVLGGALLAAYLFYKPASPTTAVQQPIEPVKTAPRTSPQPQLSGQIERTPTPPSEPVKFEPAPAAGHPPTVVEPPETLANSDSFVQKALQDLSPNLAQWLVPEEQVRKWVLTIDKLAEGKLPKRYRPLDFPMKPFKAKNYGDLSVMSDDNFARLEPLIKVVLTLDPNTLATYYQTWKPLLEQAYREQGEPGTFEDKLIRAIDRFLAVSPLEEKGVLIQPHVFYVYQNETLEQASDIEKLSWRMGKENTLALQSLAREFRKHITQH